MSSYKHIAMVACLVGLSACGFRPLYAPPSEDTSAQGVYAFDAFQGVAIANIPDREGQYLRNALIRLLHPNGRRGPARYVLNIDLSETTSSLAVQRSAEATRANLTVKGRYRLVEIGSNRGSHTDLVSSSSGYNIFRSEFQTLMAEKGARSRALDDLAQQIRIRLAAHLTSIEPGQRQQ